MQPTNPSDPFDRATEIEMREREAVVAVARARCAQDDEARARFAGPGLCLNCGAEVPSGRYCDVDCRDDHQQRARARSRNGSPKPKAPCA